jgi:hypothetical protein
MAYVSDVYFMVLAGAVFFEAGVSLCPWGSVVAPEVADAHLDCCTAGFNGWMHRGG